tara:strand:+ start:2621 stop:3904 length:1284 start_codon:yes stop_codon:yes gene_type:complete
MKTSLKNKDSFTRSLDVTVPWSSLKDDYVKEFNNQKKKFKMPGFRAGKVPQNIVKKEIGPAVEANFAELSLNKYYQQALMELKVIPINQAQITKLEFKEESDLKFTAIFEVRPDFKLPSYQKSIKFKIDKYKVSKDDIAHSLNELQTSRAKLESVDKASLGNYVLADFQELDANGIAIIGRKIEKQYIKLGEANFNEQISKPIVGKKVSDKIVIDLPFGENKMTKFEMEIKKIEKQVLPDITDDFAKSVSPDFKNVKDLKKKLEDNISKNLDDDFEKRLQQKIIDYFTDKTKVDAPKSMLDSFLKNLFESEKQKQGKENIKEEDFNKEMLPYAEKNIKWLFVRDKLVNVENIKLEDKAVEDFIKKTISDNKDQKDDIEKYYSNDENKQNLASSLISENLFECLKAYANIKINEKSTDELRKNKDGKK